MRPRKTTKPCQYAESCFDCPLKDCVAENPTGVNEILEEWLYYELVTGLKKEAERL